MTNDMVIPIFPLTAVQFPGVITPLHIFEPRYRKMIKDILLGDKTFGILYPGENKDDETPEIDRIGCSVEVIAHEEQADGRSNILCAGKDRFRVLSLIEGEPYYQAEVEFFEDDITFDSLLEPTERAKDLFLRIIAAGKKMRDLNETEENETPDLPDDSIALSFIIAASLDVSLEEKQLWLEMTNTNRRLSILSNNLKELVETYELRAQVHKIAKANGRAGKPPDLA